MTFISNLRNIFKRKIAVSQNEKSIKSNSNGVISSTEINSSGSSKDGHNFKFQHGRRFHVNEDVSYILPNDDDESDRVHQQHWILRYAVNGNYHAPITKLLQDGITVLDSGCGPGTWTFEMGENYPKSKFYGVDAAAVFPENIKPANVEFLVANVAKHIPYPDNYFDYVHQRLLVFGLTRADWDSALKEIMRVLKPGGYVELAELDFKDYENVGPLWDYFQSVLCDFLVKKGMPLKIATQLPELLENSGFENSVEKMTPLKMNHTDKLGELFWQDCKHVSMNMRSVVAMSNPEWKNEAVFSDFLDTCGIEAKQYKTNLNYYICYARKPLE